MAVPLAAEKSVDERIALIVQELDKNDNLSAQELPGLQSLLADYLAPEVDVDKHDFIRRLLNVFKTAPDQTYQGLLSKHTADEQRRIESFVQGSSADKVADGFVMVPSLGCREELTHLSAAPRAHISSHGYRVEGLRDDANRGERHGLRKFAHRFAEFFIDLFDDKEHSVTVYKNAVFENWGRTVKNVPQYTCVPTTTAAVQRIVRYAKAHDMSVRCSGYRHSWSPVFGRNGQLLISTLPVDTASKLPNTAALPLPESSPNELQTIELVGPPSDDGKQLVRLGCGVTNERLRRFCVTHGKVTMPMNVIMVEITIGGSNAPICHGAGASNKTLSDLVRKIDYVDANGERQSVSDPAHLKAASGCFGLMGIVTHLTLELDPMTYAEMKPTKLPVIEAIPPPPDMHDDEIPPALRPAKPLTPEEKQRAQAAFEAHANNDYYSEWFWFPYSDLVWVNCWKNTTDASDVEPWPTDPAIFLAFVETFTMNVLQYALILDKLVNATGIAEAAVTLFSRFAMLSLPEVKEGEKPIKTYLPDALHFQRAIQNVRVRDMEIEMPLQPSKDDPKKVDYTLVQRAWWQAILKAYQHSDKCPQRMPLEMRVMGGSEVVMAPQRGNALGTCSIEVLTLENAVGIWKPYAQEVLDGWMSLTDAEGKKLKTRPHWAKEWYVSLKYPVVFCFRTVS